jgi:hypothetical protein
LILSTSHGLLFSFRTPPGVFEELNSSAFTFPMYSGWDVRASIRISVSGLTARLEQSGLRAYCELLPFEDKALDELDLTGQPIGLLTVHATDVASRLRRFDRGWVSLSLSEGAAEARVEGELKDESGTVTEVIAPFGTYRGLACETKIGVWNLLEALNAGFRDFEVRMAQPGHSPRRWTAEWGSRPYLLGSLRIPPIEPTLFERERRQSPTVDVFIMPARD